MHAETQTPLLAVDDLSVCFQMYGKALTQSELRVISGLSLRLHAGEVLAVAGSSGSGKSLLAAALLGILPANARVGGSMLYQGQPLTAARQQQLRGKELALAPQSVAYLDPLMRVGAQADGYQKPRPSARRRSLFQRLGLPRQTERLYPFQLSGGMARRVLVATALLSEARLIIADEPTPGMSLEQALEALAMFRALADEGRAVLLITHDIDLAQAFADRVAVFYAGTTMEIAAAADFQAGPRALRHPYSKALWQALPQNGFRPIPGFQPYAGDMPPGCPFAPRCPLRSAACEQALPPLRPLRGGEVRCIHAT